MLLWMVTTFKICSIAGMRICILLFVAAVLAGCESDEGGYLSGPNDPLNVKAVEAKNDPDNPDSPFSPDNPMNPESPDSPVSSDGEPY